MRIKGRRQHGAININAISFDSKRLQKIYTKWITKEIVVIICTACVLHMHRMQAMTN